VPRALCLKRRPASDGYFLASSYGTYLLSDANVIKKYETRAKRCQILRLFNTNVPMLSRNEIFKKVLDWLYAEHKVVDQREFSARTGINEATISRIINNRVKQPSADTIRKVVDTFPEINPGYLRGEDENITILPHSTPTPQPTIDASSMVNAIIAAKDEVIESLKR
jgi:transcriptional regulator with XRE-family HTH domain